jgi:hypothetical protein
MTFDPEVWKRLPVELRIEISENMVRKNWTPSELDVARRLVEPYFAEAAKERQRKGGRQKGDGKLPPAEKFKTRDVVAGLLGTSRRTLDKIADVMDAAKADPERFGPLAMEMDTERNPHDAHHKLMTAQRKDRISKDKVPLPGDSVVQRGDVWLMGDHRLMCGDSTMAEDVKRLLASAVPHLMVTDPPYGVKLKPERRGEVLGRPRIPRGVMNDDRADWREAYALFPGDVAYVFHSSIRPEIVIAGLESVGLERRDDIAWVKSQFVLGLGHYQQQYESCWYATRNGRQSHWNEQRDQSNVWFINSNQDGRDNRTIHGTQKPVECMLRPIENSSQPGDGVYDPFVGSGTTIIAAELGQTVLRHGPRSGLLQGRN